MLGGEYNKSVSDQMMSMRDQNEVLTVKAGKLQDEVNALLIQISVYQSVAEDAETRLSQVTRASEETVDDLQTQLQQANLKLIDMQNELNDLQQLLASSKSNKNSSQAAAVGGMTGAAAAVSHNNSHGGGSDDHEVDKLNKKIAQLLADLNFERNRCEVLEDDLLKLSFNPAAAAGGTKENEVSLPTNDSLNDEKIEELENQITVLEKEATKKDDLIKQLREELKQTEKELEKCKFIFASDDLVGCCCF
jgi:DNA repair exonuclease SbcCD ATPase subunit